MKKTILTVLMICLLPFEVLAAPGISVLRIVGNGGGYSEQAESFLMTCLGRMNGVHAVERNRLSEIFIEQRFIDAGIVEENAEYMQSVGLDYVLIGELTCLPQNGRNHILDEARLNLRLIAVHGETGKVIWSGSDVSTGSTLSQAVNEAAYDCMRQLYELFPQEGYIFQQKGQEVYIDAGKNEGIKKGAIFYAKRGGKSFISPRTGKQMQISEQEAELKVIKVFPNYCIAEMNDDDGVSWGVNTIVYKKIAGKPRLLGMLGWSGEVQF